MALSTMSRWLLRIGLGKRSRLSPPEPPNRYERKRPGELIHVDIKKLGRILRPGHRVTGQSPRSLQVLADERAVTAIGFLRRAVEWFGRWASP